MYLKSDEKGGLLGRFSVQLYWWEPLILILAASPAPRPILLDGFQVSESVYPINGLGSYGLSGDYPINGQM